MSGAALGPVGLGRLWLATPRIIEPADHRLQPVWRCCWRRSAFALAYPENICVTSGSFVASQVVNGLIIGIIYGFMALGLTLIFSILGIVSFAHGEFYMVGGMLVYYITAVWLPGINPLLGVLGACVITFALGAVFERLMLTPMYHGKIDRPVEYGILVTFGLAFTLEYFVQALAGANPVKVAALRRLSPHPLARGRRSALDQDHRRQHGPVRHRLDLEPAVHRRGRPASWCCWRCCTFCTGPGPARRCAPSARTARRPRSPGSTPTG